MRMRAPVEARMIEALALGACEGDRDLAEAVLRVLAGYAGLREAAREANVSLGRLRGAVKKVRRAAGGTPAPPGSDG